MLSQLIFTRCSNGRDLLQNGILRAGGGYKVFSFSQELLSLEREQIDLALIEDVVKRDLPYDKRDAIKRDSSFVQNDNEFTDDAFIYFVPESGLPFIMDFTVRIYVQGVNDRPGNFINHAFIGNLNGYPCSFIRSDSFSAKLKDEKYYYDFKGNNIPDYLQRVNGLTPNPEFSFERIGKFIFQDDRKKVLQNAVWFILRQFELQPEDQKFIIIRGIEAEIEQWIAAIHYAFSPDVAQQISFATRMNSPGKENKYNITPKNKFTKNSSAPVRIRAMIVGVDTRDSVNMQTIRSIPNAPYVLLEDIEANEHDLEHPYFSLITGFDENHKAFCQGFLNRPDSTDKISLELITDTYAKFKDFHKDLSSMPLIIIIDCIRYAKNNKITNIPNWEAIKRRSLEELRRNWDVAIDLVKLVFEIDKQKDITNESYYKTLRSHAIDRLVSIVIAVNSNISSQSNVNNNSYYSSDSELEAYWRQAKGLFSEPDQYRSFCGNIIKECSEKVDFDYFRMKLDDVSETVIPFFDIYLECINICKEDEITFNNQEALTFLSKELSKLHDYKNGCFRENIKTFLKKLNQCDKNNTKDLKDGLPEGSKLKDFIRRNCCDIEVHANTVSELIDICKSKVSDGLLEEDLEYLLAEYKSPAFSSKSLLNEVLKEVCNIKLAEEMNRRVLPYPYGFAFFEKLIDQAKESDYIKLFEEFTAADLMLSEKAQVSLMRLIDEELNQYISNENISTVNFRANTPRVQIANKLFAAGNNSEDYPNSSLISFFALIVNKQINKDKLLPYIGLIHLPGNVYTKAVIGTVSKYRDLSFEQHFLLIAAFVERSERSERYAKYVDDYVDANISNSKIELFLNLTKLCYYADKKMREPTVKIYKDIYGSDYISNEDFLCVVCLIQKSLQKVFESKSMADYPSVKQGINKAVGRDSDLLMFYEDLYGVSLKRDDKKNTSDQDKEPRKSQQNISDVNSGNTNIKNSQNSNSAPRFEDCDNISDIENSSGKGGDRTGEKKGMWWGIKNSNKKKRLK